MKLVLRLAINVFALLVVAYLVPGFRFSSLEAVVVAAIVIGVVNTFIKPVVQLIALPFTIVTFGIVAFLINVALLYLSSKLVPGFFIDSFLTSIVASVVLSLVSWFLHGLAKE